DLSHRRLTEGGGGDNLQVRQIRYHHRQPVREQSPPGRRVDETLSHDVVHPRLVGREEEIGLAGGDDLPGEVVRGAVVVDEVNAGGGLASRGERAESVLQAGRRVDENLGRGGIRRSGIRSPGRGRPSRAAPEHRQGDGEESSRGGHGGRIIYS